MEFIAAGLIFGVYGLIILAVIVGLIYVIWKKMKDKAQENFEDRSN